MFSPVRLSPDQFIAAIGSADASEELSLATGGGIVVVEVDHAPPDGEDLVVDQHNTPSSPLPAAVLAVVRTPSLDEDVRAATAISPFADVVMAERAEIETRCRFAVAPAHGVDEALDLMLERVVAAPIAAVSLAMLLRMGPRARIADGLADESSLYSVLQSGPEFARWLETRVTKARPPEPGPVLSVERIDRLGNDPTETGDVLRLMFNRPGVHNAFNARLRDELTSALLLASHDDSIARVEIRGAGPSFCSGGDLHEFGSFPDPATAHVTRLTRSPARLVNALSDRVVMYLHGACMGAGIELPAFAARVIADPSSRIALPELSLGLIPGAGGTVSIPRRIGRHRSAYLALSTAPIDASTALRWGLVDAVEPMSR